MRGFLARSAAYVIGDVLPKALGFLLIPLYTRFLQPADLGITNAMATLGSILTVLFGLGIGGSLMRTYFDHGDPEQARRHVGGVWVFMAISTLLGTVLLALAGPLVAPWIYKNIPFYPYYALMLISTAAGNLLIVPLTLLKIKEQAHIFAALNIARSLAGMLLSIAFVVGFGWGAAGVMAAGTVVVTVFALALFVWLGRTYLARPQTGQIAEVLRVGLPLVPHTLAGWVLTLSDRIFLERFHGLNMVGLYSLGYQMGLLMDYMLDAGSRALAPNLYRMAARRDREGGPDPSGFNALVGALVLSGALAVGLGGRDLLRLMITPKYAPALDMVPWIASAMAFRGFYVLAVQWIFYAKRTQWLPLTSGSSALLNLILNLALIPRWGMVGAATSTLISYAVLFGVSYLYSQRVYPVTWYWTRLLPLACLYAALLVSGVRWLAPGTLGGITGSALAVVVFLLISWRLLLPVVRTLDLGRTGTGGLT